MSAIATPIPHINQLREHLMATLSELRDREHPMEPDRARSIALVASVLVDTAKVEVDYLKATHQDRTPFLEQPAELPAPSGYTQGVVERLPGVTRHILKG